MQTNKAKNKINKCRNLPSSTTIELEQGNERLWELMTD